MSPPTARACASSWYEHPMRIGALQCNLEGGPRQTMAVIDKWLKLGVNVEQLFHPCADSYSALFDERRHGRILRRYLAEAHRKGLRIILYLNVHIIGPRDAGRYKDWAQCRADGVYAKLYDDVYYACCMNSAWRDYYFKTLQSLARYDIDGIFLDGPVQIAAGCHCRYCQAKHQQWFGRPLGKKPGSVAFLQRTQREFLEENYRRFKAIKPEGIVYQNLPVARPSVSHNDIRQALTVNDIVGTEGGFMFYGPPKNNFLWRPGYEARLLEAIAPDKPRVIFMAADQKPWSWYQHTAAETALCMASIAANGATIWYGLHGATRLLKTAGGQAANKMLRFMKRHGAVYQGTRSAAKVALFYSYETEKAWNFPVAASDFYGAGGKAREGAGNPWEASFGFADLLTRAHLPYDLVSDLDLNTATLARYDSVILPSVGCMSAATVQTLREYVRRGGTLLATFNSSLHDEEGRLHRDFALADVLGVRSRGHVTNYHNFNYMVPTPGHRLFNGISAPYIPVPGEARDVVVRRGARVLARYLQPWPGRYAPRTKIGFPAITLNRYGKGHCLYMAGTAGEFFHHYAPLEYRQMFANILAEWVRSPVTLEGTRSPIEVTIRIQGERRIIHLVNHCSFDARPLDHIEPLHDLKLKLRISGPIRKARALALDKDLPVRKMPGGFSLRLPELREYEVIVVE